MAAGDPIRASQVKAKPVRWLWRNRIPAGAITLVAGRPGTMKSLLTCLVAAETSRNGNVILSNLEDSHASVVRPRLEAAGARLGRVHFWTPYLPRDLETLEAKIVRLKAKLVVVDPIAAHVSASIYSDQEIRQILSPLTAVLERTGCAFLAVHHTKKSVPVSAHPLEAVGGASGGLAGAARVVYLWGPCPDDGSQRALGCAKANLAAMPPALVFDFDTTEVAGENGKTLVDDNGLTVEVGFVSASHDDPKIESIKLVTDNRTAQRGPDPVKKALAAEFLVGSLKAGPLPAKVVEEDAKQAGISWSTVRRAAKELEIVVTRKGFGKQGKFIWSLPPQLLALMGGGNG